VPDNKSVPSREKRGRGVGVAFDAVVSLRNKTGDFGAWVNCKELVSALPCTSFWTALMAEVTNT
jgi:hypothetical protein